MLSLWLKLKKSLFLCGWMMKVSWSRLIYNFSKENGQKSEIQCRSSLIKLFKLRITLTGIKLTLAALQCLWWIWPIWIKREDHDGNYFKLSTGHASKRHRQPRCHKMEHLLVYSPYMAHQLRFISFLLALGTVVFTPLERSNKHLLLTHVWNSVIKFMMISQSMIVKALFSTISLSQTRAKCNKTRHENQQINCHSPVTFGRGWMQRNCRKSRIKRAQRLQINTSVK